MTDSVSLTVPMDHNALTRAADMLAGLAADMKHQGNAPMDGVNISFEEYEEKVIESVSQAFGIPFADLMKVVNPNDTPKPITAEADISHMVEPAAKETLDLEPLRQETTAAEAFPNVDPSTIVSVTPTVATATPSPASAGVELAKDSTGAMIPWDERIHGNGEKRTKADGSWKYKRNIDKAIIPGIEAELRQAMAVPTPNAAEQPAPVVASSTVTPAIAPTVEPVPNVQSPVVTATVAAGSTATPNSAPVVAAANTTITTLPALMAAATGAGKTQADMQAAAVAAGLASVALLGARPDLIPTVAASLGLGG